MLMLDVKILLMMKVFVFKKYSFFLLALMLLIFHVPAFAINEEISDEPQFELQTEIDAPTSEPTRLNLFLNESPYLTGDWGGLRSNLEQHGVNIHGAFVTSPMILGKGHGETKKTKGSYRNLLILGTELDTEKMGLYKGGTLFIQYMAGNVGVNPAGYFGSYSEIDCLAPEKSTNQIAQLYYEHTFKDDLFSLKIGKQNANEDFHNTENGGMFINHSYHISPNIPMPDCITPQMGVRAKLKVLENLYLQTGIYDGDIREGATPKGFFSGENGYVTFAETHYLADFKGYEGKYILGGWLHSAGQHNEFENFKNEKPEDYNHGGYLALEQKLFHAFEDNSGGLSILGQLSLANKNLNEIPCYCSLCLIWRGITEKRKEDALGIALAWHQYNNSLRHSENKTSEKIVEFFYKFKVTNFLSVKPGFQYIMRPGGDGPGSFALGVRTVLVF